MNKTDFFAVLPRPRVEAVEVVGASGPVYVRELSVRERIDFEAASDGKSNDEVLTSLVALAACDESGARILDDDDAAAIRSLPLDVFMVLVDAASRVNGMAPKDVEALGNA